jgi:class 3 adenylate cyclase/tetratricopeptide (TPR) repeat protein
LTCPGCGAANDDGKKFCIECGAPLGRACASCGASLTGNEKFCGECGAPQAAEVLAAAAAAVAPTVTATPPEPAAERRLVSVLFADLVGFTSLSEARDSEEVRELLSRYFETCNRLISLYGGTVEKFIGDAVMAVWGTPVATEDDAERAVRAALDLTTSVAALGEELGVSELAARAGVMTGEAAVTIGAEGQGMVAGDLVNTASRVQALAPPGAVYVGAATRRATEETVVFEDAGAHELKGKTGLVPLWRALRVVAGARGSLKTERLEAPFVGRDRELRLIKDLFHASAEEGRAHLVSVTGIAGIGKSRLVWEYFKYFDGLPQVTYWHRGRCLAYGEGVTYWALADMVRMRARIAEDEEPTSAHEKLRATLEEQILDADERRFVEPKLAQLLGLEQGSSERQELFGAWRLFFERLAETYPTVMVFEDLQWADQSLLDFIEYLLEWSRNFPLYVLTLARPELAERRPTWGAGGRNFTSLYLEPLSPQAMQQLLDGLVPGLPEAARTRILERAEGVPLYAVETVRMLLDRGLLVEDGPAYRLTGSVESLEIPETLHALIAARLDGLAAQERRLLQDAAVLGKTFTRSALVASSGVADAEVDTALASLVRKEVLAVQADPRSPEHGQYGFLQDLVRRVAYETLSRRERLARHLKAAEHLQTAFPDDDEVVEVLASHYLEAFKLSTEAEETTQIRTQARTMLVRAADRAASLAASDEARRYLEQAAELTEEPPLRAELLDRAGQMAWKGGSAELATAHFQAAIEAYDAEGDVHASARVARRLADVEAGSGRIDQAVERMERALETLSGEEDEDVAWLACNLGSAYFFTGDLDRCLHYAERGLDVAESLSLPDTVARALQVKSLVAQTRGHTEEAFALLNHSLKVALEHDLYDRATGAYFNLSDMAFRRDRYRESLDYLNRALAQARRAGDRLREREVLSELTYPLYLLGEWGRSFEAFAEIPREQISEAGTLLSPLTSVLEIDIHRGRLDDARALFALYGRLEKSSDIQERACFDGARATLARAEGRFAEALDAGLEAVDAERVLGFASQAVKQGFVEAVEAAFALGAHERVDGLLGRVESLPRGRRPPYLEAHTRRFRARFADGNADALFSRAAASFRELEIPFLLAVTLLEHAEWHLEGDRESDAELLLDEARQIFDRLDAEPWLARIARVAHRDRGGRGALEPA